MRIMTVHADYIEVEPKQKAIKDAEDVKLEKKRYEEVLVVFTSVEQGDEDVAAVAKATAAEIEKVAKQVKTNNVLIYPLVHLTSKPSSPRVALAAIRKIVELLKVSGYQVESSPFGWYKGYTLKCKGHPLSELSRELRSDDVKIRTDADGKKEISIDIKSEVVVSASLKAEEKMKSKFSILDLDGKLHEVDGFDYKGHGLLEKFATYETKKVRAYDKEPPHIKLMKEHSLVNYEPGSDPGNFRWLPKGRLIKKLLERAISDYCVGYGAMEVETPIMYDYEHPSLKKYLNRFPARQYVVLSDDKKLFLRFAACFGQFLISHDMVMSYKQLPLKMYELTRYSFRREQAGELAGLKRVRALTMPDMHTMAVSIEQAKKEFENQLEASLKWNEGLGLDELEIGFRAQTDFFNENKDWYMGMVKKVGKPVLLELFQERYAYFITKFEFNFVDAMDKASALSTVQIDVENAETYDISFVDEKGQKQRPLILHASLSGSLERVVYALLEKEAMRMKQGKKANYPLWLAPTQVRLVPIGEKHLSFALELQEKAAGRRVRVDVDDSGETLGKKIRNAEMEWCPYVAVIGDKEMESGKIAVSMRESGEKKEMAFEGLLSEIEKKTEGTPFEPISFGKTVGARPAI
ncbi:MAG: threonine--tRNA ligase [Candidatus ainarchaeum sp.]|nr:threonine--tRNA ligase [Candidatus ainarchaeum sp.]